VHRWRFGGHLEDHLGSRDVSRILYGAIIGLALILELERHPPSAAHTAGLLFGAALAVGLAELYSEAVATEARKRQRIGRADARLIVRDAFAVVFGAGFPMLFFVLAAAGAIDTDLAFRLSKWTGFGLICGYGFLAARLAGFGLFGALLRALAVAAIGGALIVLKALL